MYHKWGRGGDGKEGGGRRASPCEDLSPRRRCRCVQMRPGPLRPRSDPSGEGERLPTGSCRARARDVQRREFVPAASRLGTSGTWRVPGDEEEVPGQEEARRRDAAWAAGAAPSLRTCLQSGGPTPSRPPTRDPADRSGGTRERRLTRTRMWPADSLRPGCKITDEPFL